MSAHEYMNMARERADEMEARAEKAEAALAAVSRWAIGSQMFYGGNPGPSMGDEVRGYSFGRYDASKMVLSRLARYGFGGES